MGREFAEDQEVFCAGEGEGLRLFLVSDTTRLGFLVYRFRDKTRIDFYLKTLEPDGSLERVFADAEHTFGPRLLPGRILAITDRDAPNFRIVELRIYPNRDPEWIEVVPENGSRIRQWIIAGDRIIVSYVRQAATCVSVFDLEGNKTDEWPVRAGGRTVRFVAASSDSDELVLETESFTRAGRHASVFRPQQSIRSLGKEGDPLPLGKVRLQTGLVHLERRRPDSDVPYGARDVLKGGCHPAIMTSYGGYGVSMTPQFSVCLLRFSSSEDVCSRSPISGEDRSLEPNGNPPPSDATDRTLTTISSRRLNGSSPRAERRRTDSPSSESNSGLLVGAALAQQPDLFRAVVCMVPMLDMLRYHLFDNAHVWRDEFGTAEDPDDFAALVRYSPYHQVRSGTGYPATLIVSGDADQNCNPLHARKMAARLQAANSSPHPILLDYSHFRGHSPVLPLSDRIDALTDRMAFLCDQLQVPL